MEEFREGSKCDPWIVQALAIDLPEQEATGGAGGGIGGEYPDKT